MLENLKNFTGTSTWYKTIIPSILYTEGAKYVADECGAYWLLDDIAIYQMEPVVKQEEFQVWTLTVDLEDSTAELTCGDGGKKGKPSKTVFSRKINFTTFPVQKMVLWYTDNVILLPSEY